jgi:hypothetical protein
MAFALKALEEEDGDFCCAPIGQSQRNRNVRTGESVPGMSAPAAPIV